MLNTQLRGPGVSDFASGVPTWVIKAAGWLIAHAPEWLLRAIAAALGETLFLVARGRRRLMLSNLDHAFPDRPPGWGKAVARASSRRLVETGLLSLATPFLPERRIRRIARLSPTVAEWARDLADHPRPVVLGTLHLALWETQTWLKLLCPTPLPAFGIVFRPLNQPSVNAYVKTTRERFGMRLLSRREGFVDAIRILRGNGCVGILVDQNAGMQGALTTFLGRVCSTTELPGLLAVRTGAEVRSFHPRRTGFWRVEFDSQPIAHDGTAAGVTVAFNRWLEQALARDVGLCACWLWIHDRWRHQDEPARRLRLESKRDLLQDEMRLRGWAELPRRTRLWIRLPNWLGDVVMALPLLRALRASRPDAEIVLLARPRFLPLLSRLGVADRLEALPPRGRAYWRRFLRLRSAHPDLWLLFTHSVRGDLEARLAGAPQRFGIVRTGRFRPLLTHAYRPPRGFDGPTRHQFDLWEAFLRHFGLLGEIDRSPLVHGRTATSGRCQGGTGVPPVPRTSPDPAEGGPGAPSPAPIGLIPGSENEPAKRWPVAHWRRLIEDFPTRRFVLFGTANDAGITAAVADGFAPERVEDLAGKTDLEAFAERLLGCRLLVSNDTGGMHLANALGLPVVALFGPTNPLRTAPVFSAPVRVLQPAGCPATGGGDLAALAPEAVIDAVAKWVGVPKR